MKFFKKIKNLVIPETINFFGDLAIQSKITEEIINNLALKFTSKNQDNIKELIKKAKKSRKEKLKQLEKTFITPIDREAISRTYSQLYWTVLSIEHLINELEIYEITKLNEYQKIFDLLTEQIKELTNALELFNAKEYKTILNKVNTIIHLDNLLVLEYSKNLNALFQEKKINHILKHREILSQLKEISKRIHFCANQVEDMVFKVD